MPDIAAGDAIGPDRQVADFPRGVGLAVGVHMGMQGLRLGLRVALALAAGCGGDAAGADAGGGSADGTGGGTDGGDTDAQTDSGDESGGETEDDSGATGDAVPTRSIILFVRDGNVMKVETDGSNLTALTEGELRYSVPTPSPDGSQIVVRRAAGNADPKLMMLSPDGVLGDALVATDGAQANPTWSADGSQIAFEYPWADGATLAVIDADGSNLTDLISLERYALVADWSPDGGQLVYAGEEGISVVNADGSDPTALVQAQWDGDASWSADGSTILFRCTPVNDVGGADGTAGVCVMDADGSNMRRVSPDTGRYAGSPRWSPDGNLIAFTMTEDSDSDIAGTDIWVVGRDGEGALQVTATLFRGDNDPRFSPDSATILFSAGQTEQDLFLVDADGSNELKVTDDAETSDGQARWLPVAE